MDDDGGGGAAGSGYWKQNLYLLQEKAPKPLAVRCTRHVEHRPPQYGDEFHGLIDREETDQLLREAGEGAFLVRESRRSNDAFTLCMFFNGKVLNYKLYYDGCHFVGDKRFESMDLLVADGLISMYIDLHAADYIKRMADEAIYEDSPYLHYTKSADSSLRSVARAHNFSQYTFRAPHYCDYCRNFLWGLVHQGVRCADCGFAAHKKCSEKTLHDCRPEARYVKRMFAVDLTTLCLAHQTAIPPVVQQCIKEVESRGLTVEGIYRVSGSHDHMERLRVQFDSQQNVDLSQVDDIHTVCGLLKLYLRLLPQQLVPFSVYRRALGELSEANAYTLNAILTHLKKVSDLSGQNKMSAENLSTIFSPTLFCTGAIPALPQQQHMLLHFMILYPRVVPSPP
ncbi:hypothetical protein WR25_14740 [Diploscapter pachys]|uniref:Rho-GAP domain-containing protein n=1 Tax=Diploscapter pachys TaxID=2018661 RepID=A0A2A2JNG6_9BILA|nr:hypothetical protein WR25_14740 [Diploscapter pachys]